MAFRYPEVAKHARAAIEDAPGAPAFRQLLVQLMARPGRVLAPKGAIKWPAFVVDVCQALGGDPQAAAIAAAAVDFAVAAIDVADDLIDEDWNAQLASSARATNASLALAWLADNCVHSLVPMLGADRAHAMGQALRRGSISSCAGQDLDLLLEKAPDVTEEAALDVTQLKSGSLVAMACQVGAAVATNDARVLETAATFGRHLGVVAQLLNDIAGVLPDVAESSSDLRQRKKTLPVAFTLVCARQENLQPVLSWYGTDGATGDLSAGQLATAMHELGAIHFTWIVANEQRREALAALRQLAEIAGRPEALRLRRLVPAVQTRKPSPSAP